MNTEEELEEEEEEEDEDEMKEGLEEGGVVREEWGVRHKSVGAEQRIHPRQDLRCHGVYQAAAEDGKGAGPSRPPGAPRSGLAGAPPLPIASPPLHSLDSHRGS